MTTQSTGATPPSVPVSPPATATPSFDRALREISYEILPFRGTEAKVRAHVPTEVRLTVTTTEAKGLEPTLDLAVRLAGAGYSVAPHLAARQVRDDVHLADIVARLADAGVDGVFVVGGDAKTPAGRFTEAAILLEALAAAGHPFRHLGVGGYPEGHAFIDDGTLVEALRRKAPHATHMITQLCFDADTTTAWARTKAASGVSLPVRVGLPGVVSREKLVRIAGGLGLGQSARFLAKQRGFLRRFFTPGGYRPDRLVERLGREIGSPGNPIEGFHLFTFNELEKTEAWRQRLLARTAGA